MKVPTHIRDGNTIITLGKEKSGNIRKVHGSENEAKRASHKIQMDANGALGRGTVKLI